MVFGTAIDRIKALRWALIEETDEAGIAPLAVEEWMQALAFLELAERAVRKGDLLQARELAEARK